MASWYRPDKGTLRTEQDQLYLNAPEPIGKAVRALKYMETIVLESEFEAIVLRYGAFYGPGTWFSRHGAASQQILARKYPIIGAGAGVYSWLHIDDAAEATAIALDRGQPGTYNVTDDDPAPVREWLPFYASILGARPQSARLCSTGGGRRRQSLKWGKARCRVHPTPELKRCSTGSHVIKAGGAASSKRCETAK